MAISGLTLRLPFFPLIYPNAPNSSEILTSLPLWFKIFPKGVDPVKFKTVIDPTLKEEVIINAPARTKDIEALEAFVEGLGAELTGYGEDRSIVTLHPSDIQCVFVEGGRVYALTDKERFLIKLRLYEIEAILEEGFVKINQSCLGSISKIERFKVSIGGALMVKFKNGYTDQVSRRQLKAVKERMGFKI